MEKHYSLFSKILILTFLFGVFVLLPKSASTDIPSGADKMDLPLRMLMDRPTVAKAMLGKAITVQDGVELVDVLIKSSDTWQTEQSVKMAGGWVRSTIKNIMTAYVPVDGLGEISQLPEVTALEASKPMRLLMDTARSANNTDVVSVQNNGYNGENVVVGAIDSGLDYSRSDFDDPAGGTRVQYLRFQSVSSGSVSTTECAKDMIDGGTCSISASNDSAISHGTHVTGIAAGSDSTYTGVASAADIMLVRNDFDDDVTEGGATSGTFSGGVIDGVVEIFEKADILDKPAIINISQGTNIGAHDDTSLMEQALNDAVAGGYSSTGKAYGRIIAAAAGNEEVVDSLLQALGIGAFIGGVHAEVNVPDGSSHAWRLWLIGSTSPGRTPLVIDSWFGKGQSGTCKVAANAYQYGDVFGANFGAPAGATTDSARASISDTALSSDTSASGQDTNAAVVLATDSSDSQNERPRALFTYGPASGTSWDKIAIIKSDGTTNNNSYYLDVIVRAVGGTCSGDIWIEGGGTYVNFMGGIDSGAYDLANGASGNGYVMQNGDGNQTVTLPGTASGVIAVGAYLQTKPESGCPSQSCWTASNSTQYDATDVTQPADAQINGGTVQNRCPFSSMGPPAYAYSGRKPDVMAPGDPIISTLATGYSPAAAVLVNSTHFKNQGTSQASPHIAGIVALLLQKNNTLTAAQAKAALTGSASLVSNPNDEVGYGNANAPGAMAAVSSNTSGYSGTGDLKQSDLNGGGGGGGSSSGSCGGSIVPASVTSVSSIAIIAMLPLVLFAVRRRMRK
ncbi:MAG: S8 family serine peptidase [Pseudomonadota bacterium]